MKKDINIEPCTLLYEGFKEAVFKIDPKCSILHPNDTLTKFSDGQVITKQCARRKDWSYDWIENIKLEDLDEEYFNKDYSRKV